MNLSKIKYLTDGGIQTDLIFNKGQQLPSFSSIYLFHQNKGEILYQYFAQYAQFVSKKNIPFIFVSPSWRASLEWIQKLSLTKEQMIQYNKRSIQLIKSVKDDYKLQNSIICGCIGPRGDGYLINKKMSAEQAKEYHKFQVQIFSQQKVDQILGLTMLYMQQALGIVINCMEYKIPVVISFTVQNDGKLPDGSELSQAIKKIDQQTGNYVKYFMINCAHPSHFRNQIQKNKSRIKGIRVNSSQKTHKQLDQSTELDIGDIQKLATQVNVIDHLVQGLQQIGGCCGTDIRHIIEMYNKTF